MDRLELLETRSTITEPISVTGLSLGIFRGLAILGLPQVNGGNVPIPHPGADPAGQGLAGSPNAVPHPPTGPGDDSLAIAIEPPAHSAGGGGSSDPQATNPSGSKPDADQAGDWLTLFPTSHPDSTQSGINTPWHPVARVGGGAAMAPRGGSGNGVQAATIALVRGQVTPLHVPAPAQAGAGAGGAAASAALLAAAASATSQPGAPNAPIAVSTGNSTSYAHAPVKSAPTSPPILHSGGSNPSGGHGFAQRPRAAPPRETSPTSRSTCST